MLAVGLGVTVGGPVHAQAAAPAATAAGTFRSVTPARLLDTRVHNGGSRVPARGTTHLLVTGRGGVPASGVTAVMLSVTVTKPAAAGYLTAFADGSPRPGTSNLNFRAATTVTNQVTVRVGSNGRVSLYNGSAGTVELIADVYGWFAAGAAGAGSYVATTPTRLADTRSTPGVHSPGPHGTVDLAVAGHAGVPTSGVGAVALTVTAAAPAAAGSVDVYPAGGPVPPQPTTSFDAGVTTAGATVVTLGSGGAVTLANDASQPTGFVVDVVGYFVAGGAGPAGIYVPVTPVSAQDSTDVIYGRSDINFKTYGAVPVGRPSALLVAVTASADTPGYVTARPTNQTTPATSAMTLTVGSTASGLVVVPLANGSTVGTELWNGSTSSIVADVAVLGFFVAAPGGAVSGRVTDAASGAGLAGAAVRLYDEDPDMALEYGEIYGDATTGPDGSYTVAGVSAGRYMLCVDPPNVTGGSTQVVYAGQCWQGKPYGGGLAFPLDPTPVPVAVGSTTSGRDFALTSSPGGSVSGTITGVGGVAVPGVTVSVDAVTTTTDAQGTYHLDRLKPGVHSLHVAPGTVHGAGAPYGYLPTEIADVQVSAGADHAGADARLVAAGRIVGHVVSSTGARFPAVSVQLFRDGVPGYAAGSGAVDTRDGSYIVTGLAAGTYTVCFQPERVDTPTYGWSRQCYDDVAWAGYTVQATDSTPLTLAAGTQRTADDTIVPAGEITGTVRVARGGAGVSGADVVLFNATTHELIRDVTTESDGTYRMYGELAPTNEGYTLCAAASQRRPACYADVPWDGDRTQLPSGTTPVTVTSNQVHSGVDVVLPPA